MGHQADKGEGVAKGMCMAIRVCENVGGFIRELEYS